MITTELMATTSYRSFDHKIIEVESNEELAKEFKKYQISPKYNENSEELYCICRKPDVEGQLMVGCDGCDEWYHFKCIGLNEIYKNLIQCYYCKFCLWKGKGYTKFKRKCRRDTCWKAVDKNSKYCSKECGLQFFQSLKNDKQKGIVKFVLESKNDINELHTLGLEFPELQEVKEFEKNLDKFPVNIQNDLKLLKQQCDNTEASINMFQHKAVLLTNYKEIIKSVNEKATSISTKKKVELCMYNKSLRDVNDAIISTIRGETDQIVEAYGNDEDYFNQTCIHEKRKCPRHNGWINLINDEYLRTINKLTINLEDIKTKQKLLLRDHSISVYEQ